MCCANASGTSRLPLLLIGKSKKPRCFKNVNMNALPVHYYAQPSAWMSQAIFTDWFKNVFVPFVKQDLRSKNLEPKTILLLDNAPSHPEVELLKSDDKNITCIFLPANTTSLIQPMDQSVIETFKRRYRKKFLRKLVIEEDCSLQEYWKAYNLKNVVDNASMAWADVSNETLKRAWHKLLPTEEDPQSNTVECDTVTSELLAESAAVFSLDDENGLNDWLHCDDDELGYKLLTDEEIIEKTTSDEVVDADTDVEFDDTEITGAVMAKDLRKEAKEAASHIQNFTDWYIQQKDADRTDSLILQRMFRYATIKSETTIKQSKITEFFSQKN